ncbi:proline-rich small protein YnaL [unidentified bacterial endosymbiont]|uniref:proline-rich small protein YnaL n=1 Tax=unidentified bacterial endosymbiont TaxID=2355 RepID=UPI002646D60C|nr:hypothetical protein [unidentified bacterial endosymbiont]
MSHPFTLQRRYSIPTGPIPDDPAPIPDPVPRPQPMPDPPPDEEPIKMSHQTPRSARIHAI